MMRDGKEIAYDQQWDSYYYVETGIWCETKCGDPDCTYCSKRPEVR